MSMFLLLGALSGCSSSGPAPPLSPSAYVMQPVHELGLTGTETVQEIATLLDRRYGYNVSGEGNPTKKLEIIQDKRSATIVVSAEGFADDSVKGEQHVVEVTLSQGKATVTGHGMRYMCWRGWKPNVWTTEVCP